jgi:hypothetical protein
MPDDASPSPSDPSRGPGSRVPPPNRRAIFTELIEDAATGWWNLSASFDEASGKCQEIFLSTAPRVGSVLDALVHDGCIIVSRDCLQRGLSARDLVRGLSDQPPSLFAKALRLCADHEDRLLADDTQH